MALEQQEIRQQEIMLVNTAFDKIRQEHDESIKRAEEKDSAQVLELQSALKDLENLKNEYKLLQA